MGCLDSWMSWPFAQRCISRLYPTSETKQPAARLPPILEALCWLQNNSQELSASEMSVLVHPKPFRGGSQSEGHGRLGRSLCFYRRSASHSLQCLGARGRGSLRQHQHSRTCSWRPDENGYFYTKRGGDAMGSNTITWSVSWMHPHERELLGVFALTCRRTP